MAAIVYGGSPRHHARITNAHHLHHPNALQQSQQQSNVHHFNIPPPPLLSTNVISPSQTGKVNHMSYNQSSQHPTSSIIMPPASYLSTGSPMSSTTQQLTLPHAQYAHQPTSPLPPTQTSHYHHTTSMYTTGRQHKRKSAVELLAESKPFYVKSEMVLDRHQQLNYRTMTSVGNSGNGGNIGGGIINSSLSGPSSVGIMERTNLTNPICNSLSPSRIQQHHNHNHNHHHHHHHNHRPTNRRSASSSSDLLQNKLRKLLNADTKDAPGSPSVAQASDMPRYKSEPHKYDTFSKYQTVKFNQELTVHPATNQNDMSMMYPSAFLSPQSLPPNPACDGDIYSYGIDEPLVLTENYRAISPPAEYAAVDSSPDKEPSVRCGYQRSYSHSHDTTSDEPDYSSPSYNINSHKSLPDLHSQISRHSPHSEVLSSCSRGNRSNKSGGGSSLNRDSGGSSGHYTHRSEPCCKQRERDANKLCSGSDYRRDSGSSTQHSGNSYYMYGMSGQRYPDCPECRAKYQKDSECLLNFTTPEVPEAFQDEYPSEVKQTIRFYEETKIASSRKMYQPQTHQPHLSTQQHQQQQQQQQQQLQQQQQPHHQQQQQQQQHQQYAQQQQQYSSQTQNYTLQQQSPSVRAPDNNKDTDISPPPGTFKRQKCFRLKPRNRYSTSNERNSTICCVQDTESDEDRKPILRSKSDISDRYWNRGMPLTEQPTGGKMAGGLEKSRKSESLSQLEKFFDRLGLNDEKFDEIYSIPKRRYNSDNGSDQSSTIFFSDVSTVDSARLPDSTETQTQMANNQQQPYRPTEPPSIVERNARIIKWLCNCRKLQLT